MTNGQQKTLNFLKANDNSLTVDNNSMMVELLKIVFSKQKQAELFNNQETTCLSKNEFEQRYQWNKWDDITFVFDNEKNLTTITYDLGEKLNDIILYDTTNLDDFKENIINREISCNIMFNLLSDIIKIYWLTQNREAYEYNYLKLNNQEKQEIIQKKEELYKDIKFNYLPKVFDQIVNNRPTDNYSFSQEQIDFWKQYLKPNKSKTKGF